MTQNSPSMHLFDLHCHLDFMDNALQVARAAQQQGIKILDTTVTPAHYQRALSLLASQDNVCVALGLHPWWVADGRAGDVDLELFERLVVEAGYIGEVGLDFGRKYLPAREVQLQVFDRVAHASSLQGGAVMSLHAVKAAGEVLDALVRHGCNDQNVCIFHWFSGTSDELQRAIRLGCYFSVGEGMLASKRGREYVRAIPRNKLLVETDAPTVLHAPYDAVLLQRSLEATLESLARILDEDVVATIAQTSKGIFDQSGKIE